MSFNIVTASEADFLVFAATLVEADGTDTAKAESLAANPGLLSNLMRKLTDHFKGLGKKAWRVLKSGGVWYKLIALVAAAVAFLLGARKLRHFKIQPPLGKMQSVGIGLSFIGLCNAFTGLFKSIVTAWNASETSPEEKQRAQALEQSLRATEHAVAIANSLAKEKDRSMPTKPAMANSVIAEVEARCFLRDAVNMVTAAGKKPKSESLREFAKRLATSPRLIQYLWKKWQAFDWNKLEKAKPGTAFLIKLVGAVLYIVLLDYAFNAAYDNAPPLLKQLRDSLKNTDKENLKKAYEYFRNKDIASATEGLIVPKGLLELVK